MAVAHLDRSCSKPVKPAPTARGTHSRSGLVQRRWPSAFTLIEILVVIAIIGLLVALLIPALRAAKERSRRVVCQSNLHQFSIGLNTYANSNQQIPPSGASESRNDEHTPVVTRKTHKELLRYVGQAKLLECPWLGEPFSGKGGWRYSGYGMVLGYNYLGGHQRTPWDAPPDYAQWRSPQRLSDPANLPVLTELNAWTTGERRTWAPHGPQGAVTKYGKQGQGGMTAKQAGATGGHICLLDGSVSWKNISAMKYYNGSQNHSDGCRTMW